MLANSITKLADALRAATLLGEVRDDPELLRWIESEIGGYDIANSDVPEYRCHYLTTYANGFNGAWMHSNIVVPVSTFSSKIKEYGLVETKLIQSVGTLEGLLASDSSSFQIPWRHEAELLVNGEIRSGSTGIQQTYSLSEMRWDVPRPLVQEMLETVRHRALQELTKRLPADALAAKMAEALPATPASVAVSGSGNQIIVGSPGARATLTVHAGDWNALNEALQSIGISESSVADLQRIVDDPEVDQPTRIMRSLEWSKSVAAGLGINTAASAAATLTLQYLGAL